MFLKEYRYMVDGEEKIFHAVVTYGEGDTNANMVNVFMSQSMVDISRQFNYNDFGYEKVEGNNGYYINKEMKDGMGTVDYLDEFMNHYINAFRGEEIKEIVCAECKTQNYETFSYENEIWCKECGCARTVKFVKLR